MDILRQADGEILCEMSTVERI